MKKHILKFLVSVSAVLLFFCFNAQTAFAEEEKTYGDFKYVEIKNGSEIKITGYTGGSESVTVPEKIGETPVTTIGENAFANESFIYDDIKNITMLSVTDIENGAFKNCKFESISMPKATYIGNDAFMECTSLSSVYMPNVTSTGDESFFKCTSLTSVDMPKVTSVGHQSFSGCSGLKSVNMPNVVEIKDDAFKETGLISIAVPSSATYIGYYAFGECRDLQSVTILSDTVTISGSAFENCPNSMKIYCHAGSKAEVYARSKGIQCIILLNSDSNHESSHEHNWEWQTITEPTEYSDGMEGYVCTICGETKDTVTIPSTGVFMQNRYKQVADAADGDTVVLEMGLWHSLSKGFMEEIAKKRNTTFVIQFIYEGKKYEVVIPAGQPLILDPAIDWYGPLKQNEMFGMKEIK